MSLKLAIETTYDGQGFAALDKAQQQAATGTRKLNDATIIANSKAHDSLKKTAQVGTATFASVRAAAQTAGAAMGPVAGSIASVFTSLTAGGLVAAGVSLALGGLGYVISQYGKRAKEAAEFQIQLNDAIKQGSLESIESMLIKARELESVLSSKIEQTKEEIDTMAESGVHGRNLSAVYANLARDLESAKNRTKDLENAQRSLLSMSPQFGPGDEEGARQWRMANYKKELDNKEAASKAAEATREANYKRHIDYIHQNAMRLTNLDIQETKKREAAFNAHLDVIHYRAMRSTNAQLTESARVTQAQNEEYQKNISNFYEASEAIWAGWDTALSGMMSGTMRAREISRAVWTSVSQSFIQQISRMMWAKLASLNAISAAEKTHAATSSALEQRQTTLSIGRATMQALSWLKAAAAKLAAWFASLGPFGLIALGGSIAAMVAIIRATRMQSGGVVPGRGFGDRTPAMLEPGEFVVNRRAAQNNRSTLEAMNSGRPISNSSTANVTANISVNGNMNAGEMLSFREQLRMHLKSVFEELAYNGSFRPGLVGRAV